MARREWAAAGGIGHERKCSIRAYPAGLLKKGLFCRLKYTLKNGPFHKRRVNIGKYSDQKGLVL
jgi:hypothetical protein